MCGEKYSYQMKTALIKQKMNLKFHFKYLGTYLIPRYIPRYLLNVHTRIRLKLTFQFELSDTSFRMIR